MFIADLRSKQFSRIINVLILITQGNQQSQELENILTTFEVIAYQTKLIRSNPLLMMRKSVACKLAFKLMHT